jgi:hypothetical protein
LRNPKSRMIRLLSLSCIIRIFLLPENDNIYSKYYTVMATAFFKIVSRCRSAKAQCITWPVVYVTEFVKRCT